MSEPLAETKVRLRPDADAASFKASLRGLIRGVQNDLKSLGGSLALPGFGTTEAKAALVGVTEDARAAAQAQIAAAVQVDEALRLEIASYRLVAAAAKEGSREQITATNLAIDAEKRLARAINTTTIASERQGRAGAAAGTAGAAGAARRGGITGGVGTLLAGGSLAGGARLGAGAAAAVVAVEALRKSLSAVVVGGANFETELNTFGAVAGATGDQMDAAGKKAQQLGADITLPSVSAADAAVSLTELAKGGLSVQDSLEGARGVLQLATAGMLDNADAASIVAQNLNAFELPGTQAGKVADLLAGAAASATGEVSDMAIALSQSAAVAHQVGYSMQDTVTAIALFAKNGLLGSDAGTSFRTMLLRLIPTTKKQFEAMKQLGVQVLDSRQNLLPLPQILENYKNALSGLSKAQQLQALNTIFGQDAIRAASIGAREGAVGFDQMGAAVGRQGIAAEIAGARTKGLGGSYNALISNLETIAIKISGRTNPAIKELVDFSNQALNSAQTNWPAVEAAINPVLDDIRATISSVVAIGEQIWDRFGKDISAITSTEFGFVGRTVKRGFAQIADVFSTINSVLHGDWDAAWKSLKEVVRRELAQVKDTILSSGKILKTAGLALGGFVKDGFEAALAGLEETALRGVEKVLSIIAKIPTQFHVFGKNIGVDNPAKGALESIRADLANIRGDREAKQIADAFSTNAAAALAAKNRDVTEAVEGLETPVSKAGKHVGAVAGHSIAKAVADTVATDPALPASIDSIKKRLDDAITQTDTDVRNAVVSAQRNLVTLASGLSTQLSSIIDKGGLSQSIARIQGQLTRRQAQSQSQQLRDQIKSAKKDVADARASIGNATLLTPAQQAEIATFLKPKTDALAQAKAAYKDFQKQTVLTALQDRETKEKAAAERRLGVITDEFNRGKITFKEFTKDVTGLLAAHGADYGKVGKALGTNFANGFTDQVQGLLDQAFEIHATRAAGKTAGVLPFLGAGTKPDIVKPLVVLSTSLNVQQEIRDELKKANAREDAKVAKAKAAAAKKAAKAAAKAGGGIDLGALSTGSSS